MNHQSSDGRRSRFWLPHPAFLSGILVRGVLVWFGVRGFLLFLGFLVPSPSAAVGIVVLTAWLGAYDARRSSETILLANLGIAEWKLALVAAVPAALFELTIQLVA